MAGYDSYVKLLLHCDGTDGSTTITDETGKTMTCSGNAQIDTSQKVFGDGSIIFDGTGDFITTSNSSDFNFNSTNFTVDFRLRPGAMAPATDRFIMDTGDSSGLNGWHIRISGYNIKAVFYNGSSAVAYITGTTTLSVNTWYHIALTYDGTTLRFFVNGILDAISTVSISYTTNTNGLKIGSEWDPAARAYTGHIDELRISKGVARWTENFTPPTSAYSADGLTNVKTWNGLAKASVKTVNGLAIASVKSINSLT